MCIGRLLVVVGLPGSGKSRLIDERLGQTVTGLRVHDFHADAIDGSPEVKKSRHYIPLVQKLKAGHDCVIADIEFCRPGRRDAFVRTLQEALPGLEVEFHCLRNQPDRCIRNVLSRCRKSVDEERRKILELSNDYTLPAGAIEYDVFEGSNGTEES